MKRLGLPEQQADLLLMHLLQEDLIGPVNTALRARKGEFIVDYTTYTPELMLCMPGCKPERWMWCDTRRHVTYMTRPKHPDLRLLAQDLTERLDKHDANLMLGVVKNANNCSIAKLQIFVKGSRKIALTLLDVAKGKLKRDGQFSFGDQL